MTTASLCRVARLIFVKKRQIFSIAVPLLFLPLVFRSKAARCGYVAINMIIFLMTETLPMPIAGFLPAIFFPILGIQDAETVARSYMADAILFLIGVLIIASSVERTNLHKRIALSGLRRVGHSPYRLMLCLMSLSAFLSMWFSNTAVASMMVSIGKAIADQTTSRPGIDSRDEDNEDPLCDLVSAVDDKDRMEMDDIVNHKKAVDDVVTNEEPLPRVVTGKRSSVVGSCLMLSIAYGTNIGGSATLTGTVMPIILNAMLTDEYGTSSSVGFDTWISFAFPLQLVCLVFCYLWMCLLLWWLQKRERITVQQEEPLRVNTRHTSDPLSNGYLQTYIKNEYAKLGRTKWAEYWSLFIVVSVVILWFFADLKFISGWLSLFKSTRVGITGVTLGFAVLFSSFH
ncbi:solute carrier family 13 member 2-like [Ptychodera flava]|uniref:solute carrier family 13 member 2-like n=1 Tax=Ptychodera flava TaxID=63121 RepID=UPI00396A0EE0